MNTLQRLLSNTVLAFVANIVVKASSALLFIAIGRELGPSAAGTFNLGVTFFTVTLALSAFGLHELLVREVAPRRDESGRYLVNYVMLRLTLALAAYAVLLLLLATVLPYSATTQSVIRVLTLALFPEALLALCQALFAAHEQLGPTILPAFVNSAVKLAGGLWLLSRGGDVLVIAWIMPLGSALSLLAYGPALWRLLRRTPQRVAARLDGAFSRAQLRLTPGFVIISIFSTVDFQLDAFMISLLLSERELGWYGAAQTIMLGFWMMPIAIRTALYPVMARTYQNDPARLGALYVRANTYLLVLVLPIAAGITLLAEPIITLVFKEAFAPAVPALRALIWALVPAFLLVPSARMMVVYNRQQTAGWMTGAGMAVNVVLNLTLIPALGIVGAGLARVLATTANFVIIFAYTQLRLARVALWRAAVRPILATIIMSAAVYPLRHFFLPLPVAVGALVYAAAIAGLGVVSAEDRALFSRLFLRPGAS